MDERYTHDTRRDTVGTWLESESALRYLSVCTSYHVHNSMCAGLST